MVPALQIARRRALHNDDQILHFAAPHRVLHRVQARPQPHCHLRSAHAPGQAALGHQSAVGQVAAEACRAIAQQLLAHGAPQAVGTDQGIALKLFASRCAQPHRTIDFGIALQRAAGVHAHLCVLAPAGDRIAQQAVQVGTVHRGVGRAVTRNGVSAQGQLSQHGAGQCTANLQAFGEGRHGLQSALQAPGLQAAHAVGAELNAGPDFGMRCGALIQAHIPTGAGRRQRRRHTANAAARDEQLLANRHARFTPRSTRPARTAKYRRHGSSPPQWACRCAARHESPGCCHRRGE